MTKKGMTREEALKDGFKYACIGCYSVYVSIPQEEDIGVMCPCGCDLFMRI